MNIIQIPNHSELGIQNKINNDFKKKFMKDLKEMNMNCDTWFVHENFSYPSHLAWYLLYLKSLLLKIVTKKWLQQSSMWKYIVVSKQIYDN